MTDALPPGQLINTVPTYGGLRFQDVAKDGVTFGDEDADEKAEDEHLTKQFQPLVSYLKQALAQFVDKSESGRSPLSLAFSLTLTN
jgi:HSP90 family molecular chaperone